MDTLQFEERKRDHLRHALDPAHQSAGLSGLERVHLVHEALPDLDLDQIDLLTHFLGRPMATPFYVAGMTAGHTDAPKINQVLAKACQERGWAMGVGSQRRELDVKSGEPDRWHELRQIAPDAVLIANLGISQLITTRIDDVRRLVENLQAQAIAIHLNVLQEALQPEGTPHFRGAFDALWKLCRALDTPVLVKETGCGFSRATLERLRDSGIRAVDVSGAGGTHWGRIEGARAAEGSIHARAAQTFANWGESTVDSVLAARQTVPQLEIWASGGVRSGLDAAKLIALGSHRVGYAKPALEVALQGTDALGEWMKLQEYELKVALLCTGARNPAELRQKEGAWRLKGI